MEKIVLQQEKETLLIPLYGKAMESKRNNPILQDEKAVEIVERIAYPFENLKINHKTNIMMSIRAAILDRFATAFIEVNPESTCFHLGCGLDSRCLRIPKIGELWIDVDFPEVIELRRNFYQESAKYKMIGSSVTDQAWIDGLPVRDGAKLVIAEGLLMYLSEAEVVSLIVRLREKLGPFTFVFDAYSKLTAKHAASHPSLKRTGAVIKWGMDETEELTDQITGMHLREKMYFADAANIQQLSGGMKFMFRFSNCFQTAREAHRVLAFEIQ